MKESGLPAFLNERTLEVETPTGKQTLPNPFLGYTIDRCVGRGSGLAKGQFGEQEGCAKHPVCHQL